MRDPEDPFVSPRPSSKEDGPGPEMTAADRAWRPGDPVADERATARQEIRAILGTARGLKDVLKKKRGEELAELVEVTEYRLPTMEDVCALLWQKQEDGRREGFRVYAPREVLLGWGPYELLAPDRPPEEHLLYGAHWHAVDVETFMAERLPPMVLITWTRAGVPFSVGVAP